MRALIAIAIAVCTLTWGAASAHATHVSCGQAITTDTTLDSDLTCTGNAAIVIGASGVDLDLNGHSVRGGGHAVLAILRSSISVRNGTLAANDWALRFADVTDGLVSGVTAEEGVIRLGGQPTRNVVEDSVVRESIEVSEDLFSAADPFRRADSRIEGNHASRISVFSSDGNLVRDNDVAGLISLLGSIFSDVENGADENLVEANRVQGSFEGGIGIAVASQRNVVRDNDVVGGFTGIGVTNLSDDNVIEGNRVRDTTEDGITIGQPFVPTGPAVVRGNVVEASGQDGIAIESTAEGVTVSENEVSGNGDDGIDADSSQTTITGNLAFENLDWGIEAVPGVTDGGGNRAWSNGQPAQCLNVVCVLASCRVQGNGSIEAANGDRASFRLRARVRKDGSTSGLTFYRDEGPQERLIVRARISAAICSDSQASLFGRTAGSQSQHFRIDVVDGGRRDDSFRIRLSGGYDSGEAGLTSGDIRVR